MKASTETANVNVWLRSLPGLSVKSGAEVIPTDLSLEYSELIPLGRLPNKPARKFKFMVNYIDVDITWDPSPDESKVFKSYKAGQVKQAMDKWRKKIKT